MNNLYHATYRQYLNSIFIYGLGGISQIKNFSDSKSGIVYLATTPELAEAFAESSETAPEEFLFDVVILEIDVSGLDMSKLYVDENIIFEDGEDLYSFEYHGVIAPRFIKVI